ncbi:DUF3327 domain-containing protein [Pseudoclavibacter sp. CFCC 14310]|uniref:enterochelin esterase domain-containing protein n=1 Tax=Pseudoclavibacter sp. CFCC 14310 TaxID=2615180 RepID=UPI001300CD5C|nr:alpha/beta hydrolase-fold protein [Pseudoclavibacter sp. CFCC 14310]KAB1647398.1 DUF3327 domain-containing protein [Pseudoclavibacter sp. CFCC 14310]
MSPARRHPPKTRRPEPAPLTTSPLIAGLEARIADLLQHPDGIRTPQTLADEFRAEHPASPVFEHLPATPEHPDAPDDPDHRIVTFVLHDAAAEQVLLFINRITDETDLDRSLMHRIPGTDLWHLSYLMRRDWIASYSYQIALPGAPVPWQGLDQRGIREVLDHGLPDPRNLRQITNRAGVRMSVVALRHAPSDEWRAPRDDVPEGTLAEHVGPDGRRLWVYEPSALEVAKPGRTHQALADAGAQAMLAGQQLPLLIVLDGDVWAGVQPLPTILDNMIAEGVIPPLLAVFVDSADRERRWDELDEHGGIVDWLADRLRPWVVEHWGAALSWDPHRTVVAGQSLGGLAAIAAVVRRPDVFGGAISQSAALWQPDVALEAAARPPVGARIDLQVGLQEWVLLEPTRALAAQLSEAGVDVTLTEMNGGHDYAWWRRTLATAIEHQFGDDPVHVRR